MTNAADLAAYGGLFLVAFMAATILPAQSEAALVGLIATGTYSTGLLLTIASIGNVMGSVVNWMIGRSIERFRSKSWFPIKDAALERAQEWYRRFGRWTLLLSWAPFVGDPITVAAGAMHERFFVFLLLVAVAKIGRYIVLAAIVSDWF